MSPCELDSKSLCFSSPSYSKEENTNNRSMIRALLQLALGYIGVTVLAFLTAVCKKGPAPAEPRGALTREKQKPDSLTCCVATMEQCQRPQLLQTPVLLGRELDYIKQGYQAASLTLLPTLVYFPTRTTASEDNHSLALSPTLCTKASAWHYSLKGGPGHVDTSLLDPSQQSAYTRKHPLQSKDICRWQRQCLWSYTSGSPALMTSLQTRLFLLKGRESICASNTEAAAGASTVWLPMGFCKAR